MIVDLAIRAVSIVSLGFAIALAPVVAGNAATTDIHACDRLAAHPDDPNAVADGFPIDELKPADAIPQCEDAVNAFPDVSRFRFQLARSLYADGRQAEYLESLRAAAAAGYPYAQYVYGLALFDGDGIRQDRELAVTWIRKSAENHLPFAQTFLGWLSETGEYGPVDLADAVKWYRLAIKQGWAHAGTRLGKMHWDGRGVPKDVDLARRLFLSAAQKGEPDAENYLGIMNQRGLGGPKNYAEALRWYRSSAEHGNAEGQVNLGLLYARGLGVRRDDVEAVRWFRTAAESGNTNALMMMGLASFQGLGLPKDINAAARWYRRALAKGERGAAFFLLGLYERNHLNISIDSSELTEWYLVAANLDDDKAQLELARRYEFGIGVQQDLAEAFVWYKLARQNGSEEAGSALARLNKKIEPHTLEIAREKLLERRKDN